MPKPLGLDGGCALEPSKYQIIGGISLRVTMNTPWGAKGKRGSDGKTPPLLNLSSSEDFSQTEQKWAISSACVCPTQQSSQPKEHRGEAAPRTSRAEAPQSPGENPSDAPSKEL